MLSVCSCCQSLFFYYFFFNDTATTEIYTLSLHDALPIYQWCADGQDVLYESRQRRPKGRRDAHPGVHHGGLLALDRKSTRLNSSHPSISYAVFCLKKKK